jgi:uncharacterized repeat protein (TIGR01451 family)
MRLRNLTILLVTLHACGMVWAVGTPATTEIRNSAAVTYTDSFGAPQTVLSNQTTLRVDEVLGVTIVSDDAALIPVTTPDDDDLLRFTITNVGNGTEAFRLTPDPALAGDHYDPTDTRLFLDLNGNGIFEPGVDPLYVAGVNDPVLAADASRLIFLSNDTPAALADGNTGLARLDVAAVTGTGAPGTSFAGQGDGGTDAVVGATTAAGSSQGGYVVSDIVADLVKTQAVSDPFGGSNPIPGATLIYTLTLTVTGSGSIDNTLITDAIPAGTTYVAGSLRLDGSPLTDIADADEGLVTGAGIAVDLGTIAAPASRTVVFQVLIN